MTDGLEIRESLPGDIASLEMLYPDAFPDEDLLPLLRALLKEEASVLSLVGMEGHALVGHVIFTHCDVAGSTEKVALLGPLAVDSQRQRGGIGSALVRTGFERLKRDGVAWVYVLGDPAYYGRFGFEPEEEVGPPYALPEEWRGAWQSIPLRDGQSPLRGKLSVPPPWQQPALWGP